MSLRDYLRKMKGSAQVSPPKVGGREILWSWVGSFIAIGGLALISRWYFEAQDVPLMVGSFGASAVLVFGAVRSPLAQPRNLIGGHILSAFIGVLCWKLLGDYAPLADALAVATAIAAMHATRTLHPPGGATALIAVIGSAKIHSLGFLYVLVPSTLGPLFLLLMGLLINNIPPSRRYPETWL